MGVGSTGAKIRDILFHTKRKCQIFCVLQQPATKRSRDEKDMNKSKVHKLSTSTALKFIMRTVSASIHIFLFLLGRITFQAYAFSSSAVPKIANNNVAGANNIFEFLKWGGSTPDFDVIAKTKEYLTYIETRTTPDPSWYHKDYVLRGPVVGPINLKDLNEVQTGLDLLTAFPDLRIETFGHTIDPENPYRCLYFQRWTATHTGALKLGGQTIQPTYNNIELPVSVFTVVWTPEQKIIYELVGAVVDR